MTRLVEIQPKPGILGVLGFKEKPRILDPNDQLKRHVTISSSSYGAETETTTAELLPDGSIAVGNSVWDDRYAGLYGGEREIIPQDQINGHPRLKGKIKVIG